MHRLTRVPRTAEAMPSAASCGVPRWPTIAESASRNSGSATRARKAGTASRRISRSWAASRSLRRDLTVPPGHYHGARLGASQNLCKTRAVLWVSRSARGFVDKRTGRSQMAEPVNTSRPEIFSPQPVKRQNRRSEAGLAR